MVLSGGRSARVSRSEPGAVRATAVAGMGFAGLVGVIALAGCGGGSGGRGAAATVTPTPRAACPGATAPSHVGAWPAPVPADLPRPPSGERAHVTYRSSALTVVLVKTAMSLQQSVLFVLHALPAKGFLLGRGDAESTQADAPFTRSGMVGQIRLNWLAPCTTTWLVAVGTPQNPTGGSPLLPLAPSASPVPFSSFGPSTFGG